MVPESAQKVAAKKLGLNGDIIINNGHILADPDPSLGPPYSRHATEKRPQNRTPKSALTV